MLTLFVTTHAQNLNQDYIFLRYGHNYSSLLKNEDGSYRSIWVILACFVFLFQEKINYSTLSKYTLKAVSNRFLGAET